MNESTFSNSDSMDHAGSGDGNPGSECVELRAGDSTVTICPQLGGTIARYGWRDRPIFRPASDEAIAQGLVRQMASYPLVPYSNRIGNAELLFQKQKYLLRANAPPEHHALHGFGWQRVWEVHMQSAHAVELRLRHSPDEDWPFACEAKQIIRLQGDVLQLRLALRNTGEKPMPAGLGFHPYFPLDADTQLQASWKSIWEMGADKLPTTRTALSPQIDFRRARALAGWQVDNCFAGWDRHAVLSYRRHTVQIDATADCRYLICYAPNDGRNFIALEPVTHANNAFAMEARGVSDTGMRTLQPGETLEIGMSIRPAEN